MKQTWLRFLNPFHFEPLSVLWMAWANVIIALMFCPLALGCYFYLRPQAAHLTYLTGVAATRLGNTADTTQLRQRLINQLHSDQSVWHSLIQVWGAMAFLFATVVFLCVGNAVYQFKAYQLLKAKAANP